eukprot:735636-Pyramimonas_sp.AAC.1
MNKPGFGTKDAPWSWSMALTETLVEARWQPARADTKLYIKHRKARNDDGNCPITGKPYVKNGV